MIALKLILEGLGLGFLLYLICAIGIRNGAVGMVHLYDKKVQERVVALGLTTAEEIRKRSVLFRRLCKIYGLQLLLLRRIWCHSS